MDKRELERMCMESGEDAMEVLLEKSDEITQKSRLSMDDLCELKMVWKTISAIKTVQAMDAGGRFLANRR
ncbi:hypothetical protein [Mailhella sp.]